MTEEPPEAEEVIRLDEDVADGTEAVEGEAGDISSSELVAPETTSNVATVESEGTLGEASPALAPPQSTAEEPSYPSERIKRAAHMLFFKRGRIPGAKAWELKAGLGKNYQKVLDQLDETLKDLDLEVKRVETKGFEDLEGDANDEEDRFRYFVRLRGTLPPKEARMSGWRIDNLAGLAACLALVVSKQGKAERKEVEGILAEKAGRWRTLTLMDTFLRTGYLEQDDEGNIVLGWRTRAEIDLQSLMMLVAEAKPQGEKKPTEESDEGLSESTVESPAPASRPENSSSGNEPIGPEEI